MPSDCDPHLHIFDCDGVILNSNSLKLSALRSCLESIDSPMSFIEWAIEEFRTNFGRTRISHFDIFLRNAETFDYSVTKKVMSEAMLHYSHNVVQLYKDCEVIEETKRYIQNLPSNCLIFVVSASDESELRSLLPNKCSKLYSKNIYGGPLSKVENIKTILNITKSNKVFFYGDAVQDAKAAMSTGIHFFGLKKYSADQKSLKDFCSLNDLDLYEDCSKVELA
jgi:phosphoglycolate phosphatase-like HAD superfamily hydrolase